MWTELGYPVHPKGSLDKPSPIVAGSGVSETDRWALGGKQNLGQGLQWQSIAERRKPGLGMRALGSPAGSSLGIPACLQAAS